MLVFSISSHDIRASIYGYSQVPVEEATYINALIMLLLFCVKHCLPAQNSSVIREATENILNRLEPFYNAMLALQDMIPKITLPDVLSLGELPETLKFADYSGVCGFNIITLHLRHRSVPHTVVSSEMISLSIQ